jgi:hypothetical protein
VHERKAVFMKALLVREVGDDNIFWDHIPKVPDDDDEQEFSCVK